MLDRAHLFTRLSPRISTRIPASLLAASLLVAALTGACTKTESGSSGTSTASAAPTVSAAPGATAVAATPDAQAVAADPPAAADAAAPATSAAASAATTATAAPGSASAAAAAAPACGTKPLPDCPMQAWMKANMNPSIAASDFTALATALDKAATFAPAGYTNWVSIAKDGAKAARAQDMTAAKASCKGCHEQYKEKFKKDTATRSKKI